MWKLLQPIPQKLHAIRRVPLMFWLPRLAFSEPEPISSRTISQALATLVAAWPNRSRLDSKSCHSALANLLRLFLDSSGTFRGSSQAKFTGYGSLHLSNSNLSPNMASYISSSRHGIYLNTLCPPTTARAENSCTSRQWNPTFEHLLTLQLEATRQLVGRTKTCPGPWC